MIKKEWKGYTDEEKRALVREILARHPEVYKALAESERLDRERDE